MDKNRDECLTIKFNGVFSGNRPWCCFGEEQQLTLHFTDWPGTSGKIQFPVRPLLANSYYCRLALSYGKENPHSCFQPSHRSCSFSPIPSSTTSVPHISCISSESCYGHTNHEILETANRITSPLRGHNNMFVFWAHLQVWTRLLKEIRMPR